MGICNLFAHGGFSVELKEGTRVVYPSQGICEVEGIESLEIGGGSTQFVRLRRIYDEATVRVPVARAAEVGIRTIASFEDAEAALLHLRDSNDEPDMNWKTRQRRHQQVLAEGSLFGLADMLRELFWVSTIRPLPARERDGYDQVRRLLIEELSHVLSLPSVAVEDQLDLALLPPGGRGGATPFPPEEPDESEESEEPMVQDFDQLAALLDAASAKEKGKKPAKKAAKKTAKKTAKKATKKPAKKAAKKTAKKATKKAGGKKGGRK